MDVFLFVPVSVVLVLFSIGTKLQHILAVFKRLVVEIIEGLLTLLLLSWLLTLSVALEEV